MDEDLLLLVDGSSYLYRAFHALPPLTNSQGLDTGAMYGVLKMLRALIAEHQPKYLAIIFDAKGKNFRHTLYPDYKAHRPPMPEELQQQIQPLHQMIQAMHLPLLVIPGVEADDVIGTLAHHAQAAGLKTLISTGDKDMAQLVNDHVMLINTMTNILSDRQQVIKKFGIPPERMIDYLALVGDSADNVPGISKVGPKTAVKWLEAYGTLDEIVANAQAITGKVGDNLRAGLDQLALSRELVTIKCDVELPCKISELTPSAPDNAQLIPLLKQAEFRAWLREIDQNNDSTPPPTAQKTAVYDTILTQEQLQSWLTRLQNAELFAFDTETNSLNYM